MIPKSATLPSCWEIFLSPEKIIPNVTTSARTTGKETAYLKTFGEGGPTDEMKNKHISSGKGIPRFASATVKAERLRGQSLRAS